MLFADSYRLHLFLFIYLFVYLFICLFICLFITLSLPQLVFRLSLTIFPNSINLFSISRISSAQFYACGLDNWAVKSTCQNACP